MSASPTPVVSTVEDVARELGRDPAEKGTRNLEKGIRSRVLTRDALADCGYIDDAMQCEHARILAELSDDPSASVYISRLCGTTSAGIEFTWRVAIFGQSQKSHEHASLSRAAMLAVQGYRYAMKGRELMTEFEAQYAANPLGREDQPNAEELRREVYRDDGDATIGTLPLVSVGPGPIRSSTQKEVEVDPDDRCPNCKAVFGPWVPHWTHKGPEVVNVPGKSERHCPDCSELQIR